MTANGRASAADDLRSYARQSVAAFTLLILSLLLLLAAIGRLPSHRAKIAGDSMAPILQGLHYRIECRECRFSIEGGWQHPPDRGRVVCPNCGYRENQLDDSHAREADRVRIVPLTIAGPLERGDVIAFRAPGNGALAVKRLLALPGETPSIHGGDLYLNGRISQKSLDQLRQVAILVHDDRFRPATEINASRWRPSAASTFHHHADQTATVRGEITHRHQPISTIAPPPSPTSPLRLPTSPAPIRDFDSYNQSLSRQLYAVSDILFSGEFRLAAGESASFHLEIAGQGDVSLEAGTSKAIARWTVGNQEHQVEIDSNSTRSWHRFSLAHCDGRLLLDFNGHSIASPPLADAKSPQTPELRIVASQVHLRNVQIWRDIYYLHPHLTNDPWTLGRPLAADEYFVLGDNSPASTDSRHWQGVGKADILGKVFPENE